MVAEARPGPCRRFWRSASAAPEGMLKSIDLHLGPSGWCFWRQDPGDMGNGVPSCQRGLPHEQRSRSRRSHSGASSSLTTCPGTSLSRPGVVAARAICATRAVSPSKKPSSSTRSLSGTGCFGSISAATRCGRPRCIADAGPSRNSHERPPQDNSRQTPDECPPEHNPASRAGHAGGRTRLLRLRLSDGRGPGLGGGIPGRSAHPAPRGVRDVLAAGDQELVSHVPRIDPPRLGAEPCRPGGGGSLDAGAPWAPKRPGPRWQPRRHPNCMRSSQEAPASEEDIRCCASRS
jgi:hypothetical protein